MPTTCTTCAPSRTPKKSTTCAHRPSSFPPAAWPPAGASSSHRAPRSGQQERHPPGRIPSGRHARPEAREGAKTVRIHGKDVPVRAEVINLRQFSAHAGQSELLRWLTGLPAPPRQTYLTHGEPQASAALKEEIESFLSLPRVALPQYLQTAGVERLKRRRKIRAQKHLILHRVCQQNL